jgi:hypothetical protein
MYVDQVATVFAMRVADVYDMLCTMYIFLLQNASLDMWHIVSVTAASDSVNDMTGTGAGQPYAIVHGLQL